MTEQHLELVHMPADEREDALDNLREILWSIAPKNFLRTIVEEIAVEEESTKLKINSWDYTEDRMDSRNFDIEIVEGLVVKAVYGFNRSRDLLHVCMKEVRLTVEDKVFILTEMLNVNTKHGVLELTHNGDGYHEFVSEMEKYTSGLLVKDSNVFIDFLFDFTDVQDYW